MQAYNQMTWQLLHLCRNLHETLACWSFVVRIKNPTLIKMSTSKELPIWLKIPKFVDNTGKRHILPISILMRVTSLVQENRDLFASQIMKDNLRVSSGTLSKGKDAGDLHDEQGNDEDLKPEKRKDFKQRSKKKKKHPSTETEDMDLAKHDRKGPNYFVAVQITNPEIHNVAKKIQTGIQATTTAKLRHALVAVEKFHITLMVMHLSDVEEIKKAVESLEKCVPLILERTCSQPVTLEFEGLSTFSGGRVLFASLKATEGLDHLHYMADEITAQMKNNGIVSTDKLGKKYNPHLTVMKFDRDKELIRQGLKRVEKSQYEPYIDEVFGGQVISSLQLCHMHKTRADGYYLVEHEVFFK